MLSPDFREFVASLNAREARYLVVGAHAVAYHGHPRYTGDIDFWIERSEENALRVLAALDDFGFGSVGLDADTLSAPNQIIQLGYPPNRIDILTDVEALEFEPCYQRRQAVVDDGLELPIIGLEDLKTNKRAVGRAQDLADLEKLES
jgi:predicted nucleotidyltransferase